MEVNVTMMADPMWVSPKVALKFSSEKIPWNRLGTVFIIPQNKVLILGDSEYFRRVHSETWDETDEVLQSS